MMEALESHFQDRINILSQSLKYSSGNPGKTVPVVNSISLELSESKRNLQELKGEMKCYSLLIQQISEVLKLSGQVKDAYAALSSNLPKEMKKNEKRINAADPGIAPIEKQEEVIEKEKFLIPEVESLKLPEYEGIPKYMKGRMTYDGINKGIQELNDAIRKKYSFYLKGFNPKAPLAEKKKYQEMKKLENKDTRGLFFVVNDDLKNLPTFKTDGGRRTFFTILRHSKRVREIRGPGSILRYAVIVTNHHQDAF